MRKIFLGLLAGAVVYELVALSNACEGDTISEIVWEAATDRPVLPFAIGVVIGHLFWQKRAAPPAAVPT
jgi:hypothetical protein